MPLYYYHLAAIVAVQFALVIALGLRSGRRCWSPQRLLVLIGVGIPVGLAFDVFIGHHGDVFSYPDAGLSPTFLLFNAIFSYGAALCMAWLLPCRLTPCDGGRLRLVIAGVVFVAALIYLQTRVSLPLVDACLVSMSIIGSGEVIAVASGYLGPIAAIGRRNLAPLVCLASCSVAVGAVYEFANTLFPLWRWHLGELSGPVTECLIVLFGYFVLLHPMFILSRVMLGERSDPTKPV